MNHPSKSSSQRHHKRHDAQRSAGSGNRSNVNKYIRDCACGRGLACVGMTQAFRLLGDPRCYYVELPRYRKDPPAYKYTFRNNLRAAYLRHLHSLNPHFDLAGFEHSSDRRYVALHHFHPAVVKAFYENPLTSSAAKKHKVPISITEHELQELNMDIQEEDRILSVTGIPTGGYYFCPSYSQDNAHEDLKNLIKRERAIREEKARKIEQTGETVVPENIEISKQITSPPAITVSYAASAPEVAKDSVNPQEIDPPRADLEELASTPHSEISEQITSPPTTIVSETVTTMQVAHDYVYPQNIGDQPRPDSEDLVVALQTETIIKQYHAETLDENEVAVADDNSSTEEIRDSTCENVKGFDEREEQDGQDEDEFKAVFSETIACDFDSLWAEEERGITNGDSREKGENAAKDEEMAENESKSSEKGGDVSAIGRDEASTISQPAMESRVSPLKTKSPGRGTDHPWETPKYRRHLERPEAAKRTSSAPAHFIDPSVTTTTKREPLAKALGDDESADSMSIIENHCQVQEKSPESFETAVRPTPTEAATAAQKSAASISAAALLALKSIEETEQTPNEASPKPPLARESDDRNIDPPAWNATGNKNTVTSPPGIHARIFETKSFEENRSHASEDSFGPGVITLKHNYPGADPTLRIQVHNDLIAWESKRRTDKSELLEYQREKWQAIRSLLHEGLEEVEFAERFVSGFAKAGRIFADSIRAVCDDKMLDDSGNTVSNSFLQNRLYKKRNAQAHEYSIDTQDSSAESGQSALLNSILEAQLEVSNSFRDCSSHVENEILPELAELRGDIETEGKECLELGDSIIGELKRSEIELKNIWDVFDAMVTGDLMEYTVHGSMHGGSQHGGSMHSSFGPSTGSMQGFLSPRGEGEGPIGSSVHSPMVKSTFRQLGAVEDGWLVEMYYRSAVAYQEAVFGIAENELANLGKRITSLEERRFRRLHQVLLTFVPRQRRLFNTLPENLKGVLNELVGLRIDEDTLQNIIDESIRERSHDHLKRGASHRSAIMNRSRIKKVNEAEETEVERIESVFGNPFQSTMVLLSKVVELQPGGIRSMVNTLWKVALAVVTAEGNLHVFILPEDINGTDHSPFEAFKTLSPAMDFDTTANWTRKQAITKLLTPTITLSMKYSTLSVPKMHQRHLQVVEEKPLHVAGSNNSGGRNRFMKAMKAAADSQRSKKCTLRLSSAAENKEWVNLLERTKKVLSSS